MGVRAGVWMGVRGDADAPLERAREPDEDAALRDRLDVPAHQLPFRQLLRRRRPPVRRHRVVGGRAAVGRHRLVEERAAQRDVERHAARRRRPRGEHHGVEEGAGGVRVERRLRV